MNTLTTILGKIISRRSFCSIQLKVLLMIINVTLLATLLASCTLKSIDKIDLANPENLATFELPKIEELSQEDQVALERANAKETPSDLTQDYEEAPEIKDVAIDNTLVTLRKSIHVDIYENSKTLSKQTIVVKVNNEVKYAFATSTGTATNPTPSLKGVIATKQKFRHMSHTYPGIENNMDFVTYFYPSIGFHSTTFGNYPKLGKADSHGCVRLGKPEARILYRLIKEAGKQNTTVSVIKEGDPQESESTINLIKTLLAKDLNFISYMIRNKNNGDVAGVSEETYFNKILGNSDELSVQNIILQSVEYYNTKKLPRENMEIDRLNEEAIREAVMTGTPPKLIRPYKIPVKATFPILEMTHWELLPISAFDPEYPERIYPPFNN